MLEGEYLDDDNVDDDDDNDAHDDDEAPVLLLLELDQHRRHIVHDWTLTPTDHILHQHDDD